MELLLLKGGFAAAVLAVGLGGALLPWYLRARSPDERLLSWGDTFAGGVLGGAGLIHLLSSGAAAFREVWPAQSYPVAFLLACVGFLFVLLVEGVLETDESAAGGGHEHRMHRHACVCRGIEPDFLPGRARSYAFVLLMVLSVHSIILGLALGAQSTVAGTLIVFIAITAHKGLAGFALGISYQRSGATARKAMLPTAFFAGMTPSGILLGMMVNTLISPAGDKLFEAVFDSIGAGTFLYISAIDIIRTEFDQPGDRFQKWLSACLGFCFMAILAVWI